MSDMILEVGAKYKVLVDDITYKLFTGDIIQITDERPRNNFFRECQWNNSLRWAPYRPSYMPNVLERVDEIDTQNPQSNTICCPRCNESLSREIDFSTPKDCMICWKCGKQFTCII